MEAFAIILLIALIFLVINIQSKLTTLDEKFDALNKRINIKKTSVPKPNAVKPPAAPIVTPVPKAKPVKSEEVKQEPFIPSVEKATTINNETFKTLSEVKPKVVSEPKAVENKSDNLKTEFKESIKKSVPPPSIQKEKAAPKTSFVDRNPDLEQFIGLDLLPKIGIVIFVIGMGFLVKLGIDSGVITETMRVMIGVLCGGALVGLAHYLRKSFATFSSILIGGALAILYFTIALAFQEYGILSQSVAFIIMVLITAFGVLLSVAYDKKELAVLAIIGGFGTPFFVSTGEGNVAVLLTYILILDIGMLALVYVKKWNLINYITYIFTYILFAVVYIDKMLIGDENVRGLLVAFLTLFYVVFFLMSIIYNVKNDRKFLFPEMGMLLSNSAIYFGLGLALINGFKDGLYNGAFVAAIACFNVVFALRLYKRDKIDKNLLYLLIGLVLTFVSLIAPIQLEGNYITLFWALEAVLLLWMYQKSTISVMKTASIIINGLMFFSLLIDWADNYNESLLRELLPIVFNKLMMTTLVVATSLGVSYRLLVNEKEEYIYKYISTTLYKTIVQIVALLVLYIGIYLELDYQLRANESPYTFHHIILGIYHFGFFIGLLIFAKFKKEERFDKVLTLISLPLLATYLSYYLSITSTARDLLLKLETDYNTGYYAHYILLTLFIITLASTYKKVQKQFGFYSPFGNTALWIMVVIGVFVATAEFNHIGILNLWTEDLGLYNTQEKVLKAVYPAVWTISALLLMIMGMRFKLKTLRVASLGLFLLTILKLFLFDLKDNPTGKVVSFILLGVILLVISFLYQKLKFIIQDDDEIKN